MKWIVHWMDYSGAMRCTTIIGDLYLVLSAVTNGHNGIIYSNVLSISKIAEQVV